MFRNWKANAELKPQQTCDRCGKKDYAHHFGVRSRAVDPAFAQFVRNGYVIPGPKRCAVSVLCYPCWKTLDNQMRKFREATSAMNIIKTVKRTIREASKINTRAD